MKKIETMTMACGVCGATGVPLRTAFKMRVHMAGKPYEHGKAYVAKTGRCDGLREGEDEFLTLLRNAGIAKSGLTTRMATDDEKARGVTLSREEFAERARQDEARVEQGRRQRAARDAGRLF